MVGHHAHAEFVQLVSHACGHQHTVRVLPREHEPVQLGHDHLRDSGGVVLLGHGDRVHVPQPAEFELRRFEHVPVQVDDGYAVLGRGEHGLQGVGPVTAEHSAQIAHREFGQRRTGGDVCGHLIAKLGYPGESGVDDGRGLSGGVRGHDHGQHVA